MEKSVDKFKRNEHKVYVTRDTVEWGRNVVVRGQIYSRDLYRVREALVFGEKLCEPVNPHLRRCWTELGRDNSVHH